MENYIWSYIEIPFRPSIDEYYAYSDYKYEYLPMIDESTLICFNDTSMSNLRERALFLTTSLNSPTSCYVPEKDEDEPNMIYIDQQYYMSWFYKKEIGVYYEPYDGATEVTVAESIPEFFKRIFIENNIWRKTIRYRNTVNNNIAFEKYARITHLLEYEKRYLKHYYDIYSACQ